VQGPLNLLGTRPKTRAKGGPVGGAQRRHSKVGIVCLLGILSIVAAVSSAIPAVAQNNIGVYVAYADSFHPAATNFPTPWLGSSNTTFEGCAPVSACEYDGGAIRVVNNSPSPVTVSSITVHIDSSNPDACVYTGWPSAVLAPGADLIVTQLGSGAADGCTGPTPTFLDLSDVGPGGINYVGNCTHDGLIPEVDVTIDGTTTIYHDTGQVLNSSGFDAGNCGAGANESSQWTKIGTGPCPGSSLTLAPPSQTDQVLSKATVTATFTNSCNQPLSNADVNFTILSGPNAGQSGSVVTNVNGQATFSYSSSKLGTDTLKATIQNLAGTIASNTVTVTWVVSFAPGGGGFVISDVRDINGHAVYWWGAQWWKNDPLSTGWAPASFKGFADSISSPMCGASWTTRPGNSSKPPKAVPANTMMAVIVSSNITKRGSTISGNILHIVLVRTNGGYGPNPGHPGTGTIVRTIC
jgi:hypothetical protein